MYRYSIPHNAAFNPLHACGRVLTGLLIALLAGCSTSPTAQQYAEQYQANLQYHDGKPFRHAVFVNRSAFQAQTSYASQRMLHVYLEGDGVPFEHPGKVADDPTPRTPLMLQLMQMDSHPAIYLGRPCYYFTQDSQCSPIWWTHNRYNESVINSLQAVLNRFRTDYDGFVLMGHSGGGTLAILLAERMPEIKTVVTLAANLDTDAWTLARGFTPLMGSLNPARRPPLRKDLIQIHYAGDGDAIIKADWIKDFADRQQRAEFHLIKDVDHACCWATLWPDILTKVSRYRAFTR